MVVREPQSAVEYNNRTTAAVKSVLVEIAQVLGSFEGKFAVIGGAVPWLLLSETHMPHSGTVDVDLALDPTSLSDGEYVHVIEALQVHGYHQDKNLRRFQLVRTVPTSDGGPDINIVVDFLMPRDAQIAQNRPPLLKGFAVQRADGAELALRFNQKITIDGNMPGGGRNRVRITVASIPALLAMKGYAIAKRKKPKDAYDIYYSVRNYPNGIDALVEDTQPLLDVESGRQGYSLIAEKFRSFDDFGPTSVRTFVDGSPLLGDRTADQWQQDAFGQVDAWLRGLGLR